MSWSKEQCLPICSTDTLGIQSKTREDVVQYVADTYNYFIYEQMDPRVEGWFMMDSPGPITLLVALYLLFIRYVGPWWMEGRQPYNVDKPMLLYNTVQMAINAHFVYVAMKLIWIPGRYSVICQGPIYGPDTTEDILVAKNHLFMLSRHLDLLDTVFMVLKKNTHQISFLHVYHHILVAVTCWLVVKYLPGGQVALFGTINSFVHLIMYSYYFLTAYDASYKKFIWLKRHITELQLAQFVILIGQQCLAIISKSCSYPKYLLIFFLSQAIMMMYLFGNFYFTSYVKNKKSKKL